MKLITKIEEYREHATFLRGASAGLKTTNESLADVLEDVADKLEEASRHMCGQGYFGCNGGLNCDSDHK